MAKKSSNRMRYMFVTCVVIILVLLIIVVWLAATRNNKETVADVPVSKPLTGYILPQAIKTKDGLKTKWFPNATLRDDVSRAVSGSYNMIEVSLRQSDGGPDTIMLDNVWETLQTNKIGVKINVRNIDESVEIIGDLKDRTSDQPLLISVLFLSPDSNLNWTRFVNVLSSADFNIPIAVNIDITKCCDTNTLGHGTVEYLGFMIKGSPFSMSVEVDADLIRSSWTAIKWLLDTNPNLQLILSTKSGSKVTKYDLLLVRNDIDDGKVFYNIDGDLYRQFIDLASTAGSPLLFFDITPRDASKIIWSHNTDTWELLNAATQGDVMMVEGDIMLLGQDTQNQTDIPIMAHDVGDFNNLTFEQWLDEIIKVNKGMKLDFKTIDAVRPALEIVSRKKSQIKGPVWANADIIKGPNNGEPRIPAKDFLDAVQTFPNVVLSPGWKVNAGSKDFKYTMSMVQEMYDTVMNLTLPITFPVNSGLLIGSWPEMEWLLGKSRDYTLTVWHSKQDTFTTKAYMDNIRRNAEASRIYFDLPEHLRPTIN